MEIARVEFELGNLPKHRQRETQQHWFQVYNGARLPGTKSKKRLNSRRHFIRKLADSLLEIDRTFRLMRQLEQYAARPNRFQGEVTNLDFLGYLIESHLQEVYILRERIEALSKFLERVYRKDVSARRISTQAKRIRRVSERTLRGPVTVRGAHVHVRRHRCPDIERLEFMRNFGSFAPPELRAKFNRAFSKAYRDVRDFRLEHMREVNDSCQVLLNFVGANALHILLRKNLTEFVFPRALQSR